MTGNGDMLDDEGLLPLFPLQTVLFPGGLLPLKVFEARYLDLISQCLRNQTGFGVVCIGQTGGLGSLAELHQAKPGGPGARPGREPASAAIGLETVGVLATLLDVDAEQAGILRVRCQGGVRLDLSAPRQREDGLWLAEASAWEEESECAVPDTLQASARALAQAIESLAAQDQRPFLQPYQMNSAGWVANRWCEILPISLAAKQRLMVLDEPALRLKLVDEYLRSKGVI